MLTTEQVKKSFNDSERYIAFLMNNLPRLQSVSIHSPVDPVCKIRNEVLQNTLDQIHPTGGVGLEFGVYTGATMRFSGTRHPKHAFVGFDSFEGFPDDGRSDWDQDFAVKKLPNVPDNCVLIKGWFSETLPKYLETNSDVIDFINIDCDIYSSTVDVFSVLENADRIKSGLVIFFDELVSYSGYIWNEALALFQMLERTGLGIEWLCVHQNVRLIDETLVRLNLDSHPTWEEDLGTGYRQQASLRLINTGIDYGPLHIDHYALKAKKLACLFDKLTEKRKGEMKN